VLARGLSCRANDVCGHDISGVSVQRRPGSVIAHSGSRIGVRSGFLHVPQWHAGVERRDGAEPACHRGSGAATGFLVASEALDVGTAGLEQPQVMVLAPAGELAQIQLIRLTGQPAVSGQEPSQGQTLSIGEYRGQSRMTRNGDPSTTLFSGLERPKANR
jgi:hypothetical protein